MGEELPVQRGRAADEVSNNEPGQGSPSLEASYRYDPFGRRIAKSVKEGNTTKTGYFLYSEQGLMGEADSQGKLQKAYGFNPTAMQQGLWSTDPIWQANASNASLTDNGTSFHYLHTDHLGTPQLATTKDGQTNWKAQSEAFGAAGVLQAQSTIEMNLRFPGQYFDEETGAHYNFFRNYISIVGRYLENDPVRLNGGVNLFEYGASNAIRYIDSHGRIAIPLPLPPVPVGAPGGGGAGGGSGAADPDSPRPPIGRPIPDLWPRPPDQEPCWRYEYRDCNSALVYIGITNDLNRRAREHEYDGVVAKYACKQCPVTKTYWEEAPNRATCSFREKLSIVWWKPIFNTTYNPTPLPILLIQRRHWKKTNCPECEG